MSKTEIPITRLRKYYKEFKAKNITGEDGVLKTSNQLIATDNGKEIAEMFNDSVKYFESYNNIEEGFYPEASHFNPKDQNSENITGRSIIYPIYKANKLELTCDDKIFKFSYVDYEVSPWRTTNSKFDDGSLGTKSGRGGIDLLLSYEDTTYVCEIKSKNDTDTFSALLQSLTYASELITENQQTRLEKCYSKKLKKTDKIGIIILNEKLNENSKERVKLFENSQIIAKTLIEKCQVIHNIIFATVKEEDSYKATLDWQAIQVD